MPLLKGVNQVDFSWANTAIDKDSIQFRALADPEKVKVLSVSYLPNENTLLWQVSAEESGPARVRISYIVGQLNKSFEYRAVASHDENTLTPTLHDFHTVQMTASCPPGQKTELPYHIRALQGYLAKQQNVTLVAGN